MGNGRGRGKGRVKEGSGEKSDCDHTDMIGVIVSK